MKNRVIVKLGSKQSKKVNISKRTSKAKALNKIKRWMKINHYI